nr:hypothetical protein Iba_chr15bCG3890 [Ipomoea batatas]
MLSSILTKFNREEEISQLNKYLKQVEDDAKAQHKKLEHAMEEIGRDYCKTDTMRLELLKENAELRQRLQLSEEQKEETNETKKGKEIELDQMKTALEITREGRAKDRQSFNIYVQGMIDKRSEEKTSQQR